MFTDVNPEILVWARKEGGYGSVDLVAQKLKIPPDQLTQWETDGKKVNFNVLELIAKVYKRQTAIFFLPNIPASTKKPKDHRNLSVDSSDLSSETLLAIRRTSRYLQIARETVSPKYWEAQYGWIKEFNGRQSNSKKEAESLRIILDAPLVDQMKQPDADSSFRYWRNRIEEKLNIFVFQFPIPNQEMDGFSYTLDGFPYAVVINNNGLSSSRKVFTLFHELAHIFRRESGVCITDFSDKNTKQDEFECNDFAGQFLVPENSVGNDNSYEEIHKSAKNLNVSNEVYLWRLFNSGRIVEKHFYTLLAEIRKKSKGFVKNKKKTGSGPSMIIQSKSTRGNKFFNLVTSAAHGGRITFSAASDLLGLKIGSIKT